jgi:hypothetical protein
MTDAYFAKFIAGIRKAEKLNASICVGNLAVRWCTFRTSRGKSTESCISNERRADPGRRGSDTGVGGREYEKGWPPHL